MSTDKIDPDTPADTGPTPETTDQLHGAGALTLPEDQFADEDNNPFDHTSLSSMINDKNHVHTTNLHGDGGPDRVKNHQVDVVDAAGDASAPVFASPEESVLLYTNPKSNGDGSTDTEATTTGSIQINTESRVMRLLRPSSNMKVQITEANNSSEGMSNSSKKYIVYTIKLINEDNKEEVQTRRRYSDFESLREILTKVFPLVIIPPIPPKNYINFSILNNIVTSKGSNIVSPKQKESTNNYSYINSTHLNSNKLIEHRKRLLTSFLNNCLNIRQIRNLEFFSKFLDPNTNWQDEINLISNQLPKDIYHSNPENGLKTDAVYASLPHFTTNINMGFLNTISENSKKLGKSTGKLINGSGGGDPENSVPTTASEDSNSLSPKDSNENDLNSDSIETVNTSHLDDINRKIMDNFIGLANDYTELGTVFNSFSLLLADAPIIRTKSQEQGEDKDVGKLNIILDKMGQVFDRSYITINALISDLETKFSEPLGEEVQYSTTLRFIQKFQRRKDRQKKMLDSELKEKKATLQGLLKVEEETATIENAINSDPVSKQRRYQLDQNAPNNSYASRFKFPNMNSIKKITQYVSDIMDQNPQETRKHRISDLKTKINTLEKCQDIMLGDISYIADELNKNFKNFHKKQLKVIYDILLCYNGFLVNWAKKNLDIWEEIREEVVKL
ncbi:Sorting nexin, cytoplasm-to-vacuole targeting pathway/endosomal sorting [Yamadazyma tenuis]|nr:Sorting nexin, cytoplasm-to-vacuole targeting pathway/endosomal sorting [Yamadazyma tenuis]